MQKKLLRIEVEDKHDETKKWLKKIVKKDLEERKVDSSDKIVEEKVNKIIDRKQSLLRKLKRANILEFRPIKHISPQTFYHSVGVADYRYFDKYEAILGIKIFHEKVKVKSFSSVLWLFEYQRLLDEFYEFRRVCLRRCDELEIDWEQLLRSGVSFPQKISNRVKHFYESTVRDRNIYQFSRTLEGNPFIFISNERDNLKMPTFCLQSYFFNIEFIISSLYQYRANSQSRLISSILAIDKEYIKRNISQIGRKQLAKRIVDAFNEKKISKKIDRVTSPKDRRHLLHFNQIEKSRAIVDRMSRNGIAINLDKMEDEISKQKGLRRSQLEGYGLTKTEIAEQEEIDDNIPSYDIEDEFREDGVEEKTPEIKLKDLEKLRLSCWRTDPLNPNIARVYGKFSPHGARTHRMTSRGINIQGISEDIREHLFTAPAGKVLLSADVAGQDIVVAATLAKRLYDHPEFFQEDIKKEFNRLNKNISIALKALSNTSTTEYKPIDHITDNVLSQIGLIKKDNYRLFSREDVRKLVKRAVYTRLYGGNKGTFTLSKQRRSYYDQSIGEIIDTFRTMVEANNLQYKGTEEFIEAMDSFFVKVEKSINNKKGVFPNDSEFKAIESLTSILEYYKDQIREENEMIYMNDKDDIESMLRFLSHIDILVRETDIKNKIYDPVIKVIRTSYPGILDSFQYYQLFYEENDLTYPTLLGWQTVVDVEFDKPDQNEDMPSDPNEIIGFYHRKKRTRSKSYPAQASGAEFIRQWLIEIDWMMYNRKVLKGKDVKLVDTIHDQTFLEVPQELKDKIKKAMISSAKNGARKIGIDPMTLHIPKVEEIPFQ